MEITIDLDFNPIIDNLYGDKEILTKDSFTTKQVAEILNIKIRTLQEWCEKGIIQPDIQKANGHGSKRLFSKTLIERIALVQSLRDNGFSKSTIKKIINNGRYKINKAEYFSLPTEYVKELMGKAFK